MTLTRGWHPDPGGDGERFHDGSRWTGVTRGGASSRPSTVRHTGVRKWRRRRLPGSAAVVTVIVLLTLAASAAFVGKGPLVPLVQSLGIGGPDRLRPVVVPQQASRAYKILKTDAAGDPVTYDPCRPIHYVINPAGAPRDYLAFIMPAINAAQEASGLRFDYDGISEDTWESRQGGTNAGPIVVAFLEQLKSEKATSDTVGLGGSTALTINGIMTPHYVTGAIALKRDWFARQSAEHNTAVEQAVVMHELGHVLGLGHVEDPAQLMYSSNAGQLTYSSGDLNGLAKLGSGRCGA